MYFNQDYVKNDEALLNPVAPSYPLPWLWLSLPVMGFSEKAGNLAQRETQKGSNERTVCVITVCLLWMSASSLNYCYTSSVEI